MNLNRLGLQPRRFWFHEWRVPRSLSHTSHMLTLSMNVDQLMCDGNYWLFTWSARILLKIYTHRKTEPGIMFACLNGSDWTVSIVTNVHICTVNLWLVTQFKWLWEDYSMDYEGCGLSVVMWERYVGTPITYPHQQIRLCVLSSYILLVDHKHGFRCLLFIAYPAKSPLMLCASVE